MGAGHEEIFPFLIAPRGILALYTLCYRVIKYSRFGWDSGMGMKRFRSFLGMIILFCLAGVGILAWYTVTPPADKNPPSQESASPADLKLDRLRYTETREGVKEWELEASSAQYFKEEGTIVFDNVKATFFGKNRETYFLEGVKGRLNTQTKAIEAFDGVKMKSSNGYQMSTRSLRYQADKRELSTADPIEMSGPDGTITGIGLIVYLEQERMKVLNQVTTILVPANPQKPRGKNHEQG
jgi:LPS export ABC transporter protein LptC